MGTCRRTSLIVSGVVATLEIYKGQNSRQVPYRNDFYIAHAGTSPTPSLLRTQVDEVSAHRDKHEKKQS
jgi:hypothetical protein